MLQTPENVQNTDGSSERGGAPQETAPGALNAPADTTPAATLAATLALIVDAIETPSPTGVAAAIHRLIRSGALTTGDRLPTVRGLASALGVSPSTISEAWQALGSVGAVQARGRAGTFVSEAPEPTTPRRFVGIGAAPGAEGLDLSTGTPCPELLPSLREALQRVTEKSENWTTTYLDPSVLPGLSAHLRHTWPFEPQSLTVVDGALDALSRIVDLHVHLGDRVVVEDPGFPPLLDMLERAGAELLPVSMDEHGIVADELLQALTGAPVAVFLQPRAQNPTGTSMTVERASELADVLRATSVLIVEDDHSGDIATGADVSIGVHLPEQVVHIRSYSKSHGPDLRIAAVGGSADIIEPLVARRLLGPAWTSRLLQSVLLELLTDPAAIGAVTWARSAYAMRGLALRAGLSRHGVRTTAGDGINVWVEVDDERSALLALAAQGIKAAPGAPFEVRPSATDHIRVTTGLLHQDDTDQFQHVITAIAHAATTASGPRGI